MITTTEGSSRCYHRRNITIAILLLTLTLRTLAATQPSAAVQSKVITTIIPSNVELSGGAAANDTFETLDTVTLTFRPPTLPARAVVVKAMLQLSLNDMMRSSDGNVRVNFVGSDKQVANFGSRNFNVNTPEKDKPMLWTTTDVPQALKDLSANQSEASFALQIVPGKNPNPARRWYSINAESRFRPRLILEYNVPERPPVVQTEGVPATHSPKPFLPSPTVAAQFSSRAVANVWSYMPVFNQGLLYLISQNQLQALPALGGPPVWSQFLTNPGQHLLRSESGRIYIVGNNQILVYQLDLSNAATSATEVKTSGGQPLSPKSMPDLNPTLAPAVGPDGSLYFVNGLSVYGLNPALQELWKVTLESTKTSRLTVGPSGQFLYLLGKTDGEMGLIAIDTRTGDVSTVKLPNSDRLKSADNPTLHAPIVLLHPDGTEKIYVAANSVKEGTLTAFDNPKTTVAGAEKSIIATAHWTPLTGLFSQPTASVGDDRKIYSVQVTGTQGQLKAIGWLTGSVQPVGTEFRVDDSSYLLNGGNLAIDQTGNILVWNGTEAKLYAFSPAGPSGVSPAVLAGLAADSLLLFGSDGTLYAPASSNSANRMMRAILPQYTLIDSSNAIISSPTNLRVDGTVNKATTLSAPGSVFLGSGFTVKQGATLTVKPKP